MLTLVPPPSDKNIKINLNGPRGNVFSLMGLAQKLCGTDRGLAKEIVEKMMASDYENAIRVFDNYFGNYVTLYR